MIKDIILVIFFAILVIGNIWAVIFVHIPLLRKENKTFNWIGIGISVAAISVCSMWLGKLLYILSIY